MKFEDDSLKCYRCGGWARPAKLRFEGVEMRGWKCACGEEYLHPDDLEPVLIANKARHGAFKTKISKVGNSYSARIPKPIVDAMKLKGKTLTILMENGCLVLAENASDHSPSPSRRRLPSARASASAL
jgi:antitoxin component of MazEF toxin-antitoxin module